MGFLSDLISTLPLLLLQLPLVLFALSFHETAHGFVANKLGDPTARSLGRLTLNPAKHIDPLGFISMLLFHVGWAKPVPINTRYFKKPKRDMALCGAAGPLSNLLLALISLVLLRVTILFIPSLFSTEMVGYMKSFVEQTTFKGTIAFTSAALVVYLLYTGIILNISLAIFNLIPVPPFDGSRIFYAFLPTKWYFAVMKYEQIIMIVMLVLIMFGALSGPLSWILGKIVEGLLFIVGMPYDSDTYYTFAVLNSYVNSLFSLKF